MNIPTATKIPIAIFYLLSFNLVYLTLEQNTATNMTDNKPHDFIIIAAENEACIMASLYVHILKFITKPITNAFGHGIKIHFSFYYL